MKFIFCTCNVSMMDSVVNLLDSNHITDYQIIDRAIAKSLKGAPRLDNPIWPGYNVIITIQCSDNEKAVKLIELLRNFNKNNSPGNDELISVCSWEMDNYIID